MIRIQIEKVPVEEREEVLFLLDQGEYLRLYQKYEEYDALPEGFCFECGAWKVIKKWTEYARYEWNRSEGSGSS
jgi:hypothetical protein